jgi:uncharacterized protein YodC (DUF2158 family)
LVFSSLAHKPVIRNRFDTFDGAHMLTSTADQHEQFCTGDVVTPKGGGARMTVTHVGADEDGEWLLCQWFDERGELRQEKFMRDALSREPRSISPGLVRVRRATRRAGSRA